MSETAKLNIAFIVPTNAIAGGVFVAYLHAEYLHRAGHQVTIVFEKFDEKVGFKSFSHFTVRSISLEEARRETFEVAIATWWKTVFSLAKIQAKHYLYFVQSDERKFYPENDVSRGWVSLTYSLPGLQIITEARWIQAFLETEFYKSVEYAPNGVDTDHFRPEGEAFAPRGRVPRILIEGPPDIEYKRVEDAFAIVSALQDKHPFEVWYVSSRGKPRSHWQCTRFFEAVPYSDMPKVYRSCDILIKVSSVEGFFGPPLEMMACGGTALVSNVTGFDEYVVDEKNALVIDVGDRSTGIQKLERLLTDPNLVARLKLSGLQTAKNLDWKLQFPKFEAAIYAQINRPKSSVQEIPALLGLVKNYQELYERYGVFSEQLNSTSLMAASKTIAWFKNSFPVFAKLIYRINHLRKKR